MKELLALPYEIDYSKIISTKSNEVFDLSDVEGRKKYYQAKVGNEIEILKKYLKSNTFIGYMLAPKNAGKGTYLQGLEEALGSNEYFAKISVGDLVRDAESEYKDEGKNSSVYKYFHDNYRGQLHIDKVFYNLATKETGALLPTEFILFLIKRAVDKIGRKTIFLDGFPRQVDQISYSLFLRDLINYREDPDCFVIINIPITVIKDRMEGRVICPKCKTPRGPRLLPTKEVGYDKEKKEFYLICDNPGCDNIRMIPKEGDNLGIEAIKDRILLDRKLIDTSREMYGVNRIELYNSFDLDWAKENMSDYELTKETSYEEKDGKVIKHSTPYLVKENGKEYYSALPPFVVVQFIKQLVETFVK
ncbi:MAG TPA: hypothetical protein VHA74_00920 [Candidatus Dojkabacteria bacterium]|nr:hypothetical protein [Candidatus Dojkabacteria bacterium]